MKFQNLILTTNGFRLFFFCLSVNCAHVGNSQHISGAMQFANPVELKDSNSISFSYSNLFYFRDYEYTNSIQTGYTLFGTWHYPRIVIQPNTWLKLEGGALLQKDFGDQQFDKAWPMFSVQLQQKNVRIIFGALESHQTHQLIEPLMSFDKMIERPIEEGLQLKLNTKRVMVDLWLDWEIRQKENSNFPEELTGGLSLALTVTKPESAWEVKIPAGFIMPHKGGQLDTNHSVVSTVFNNSTGISAAWKNPAKDKLIQQIKGDAHYIGYKLFQDQQVYPYNVGDGVLLNFLLQSKWNISFLSTYWKGNNYVAPQGGKLYQSISSTTLAEIIKNRNGN